MAGETRATIVKIATAFSAMMAVLEATPSGAAYSIALAELWDTHHALEVAQKRRRPSVRMWDEAKTQTGDAAYDDDYRLACQHVAIVLEYYNL